MRAPDPGREPFPVSPSVIIERMGDFGRSDVQRLFDDRTGLVTQGELTASGIGRGAVRHLLDTGRWQRVLQGVYAVSSGPLTRTMVLEAALLYGGGAAMLSHRTAAEVWGMLPVDDAAPVHITVPVGKSALSQRPTFRAPGRKAKLPVSKPAARLHPGVVVHRSRAHAHIGIDGHLPRTTKVDTALDLATAQPSPREAYLSLIATVTNAGLRLHEVRRRLEERPPFRYRVPLADAVALLADGVQSVLEYHYAVDVEQAHALPVANRQSPVVVDGRTLYEDCTYDDAGCPLTVRLDGRWAHSMREVAFRDRRRDNAAELAGRARLVFGYKEVASSPCEVAEEVETVLARLGWIRDVPNPCGCGARFR